MICETESFATLIKGFEQGVLELGGVACEHRTDNLTAATQKMGNDRIFTQRWREFLVRISAEMNTHSAKA
jgi:hypothetical protein